jgi:glycosyltransferase A (GT-A) superfamily protein (DUF2064 family)
MGKNRDNAIILLLDPPEADKISPELKTAFGPERAAHVNSDLLAAAYKLAKNFGEAILILSYAKTSRHPDLTWLDPEDPGFLEVKSHSYEDRLQDAFRLAFFTGAKKALLINHLSPELKTEWLAQAFDAVSDKAVALGANQDGSFYLIGLTQQNLRVFETPGFSHGRSAEALAERAKKHKLAVAISPETYSITGEDTLLKWMESREALPPLFQAPAGTSAAGEAKKQHRRRDRHQDGQARPPETPAV